jgi:hypothetical protein
MTNSGSGCRFASYYASRHLPTAAILAARAASLGFLDLFLDQFVLPRTDLPDVAIRLSRCSKPLVPWRLRSRVPAF